MTDINPDMTADQYTEVLIAELIKTEDFKRVTRSFIHAMVQNWAGDKALRKRMAPSIKKRMENSLIGPAPEDAAPVQDITALAAPLIALTNDLLARIEKLGGAVDEMDDEKIQALIESVVQNVRFEKISAVSDPVLKALTRIREKHPTFLADMLQERLPTLISALDFTAVTAFLAASRKDITAISRIINEALWQSPDRLTEALEIIPAAINLLASIIGEYLQRFSKLKVEDLTDIFLQLVDRIDGESLGAMLNANAQINRKIMKGTRELRDPNTDIPSSENVLMRKIEEIAGNIDPNLIFTLRLSIEEMKVPFREWLMSDG